MLRHVVIRVADPAEDHVSLDIIRRELPTITIAVEALRRSDADVRRSEWRRRDFDFWAFDRRVDAIVATGRPLVIEPGSGDPLFALRVLNRCQRHIERRNADSDGEAFDSVLETHRRLHDLGKPLVRADFDHARDVWQWVLRLDPDAAAAVQIAALFHDVERLSSEADRRVEHLAADYGAFKSAHARAGAGMMRRALADLPLAGGVLERAAALVVTHETPGHDGEVALLNDADALSFLSFNSPGYADYFDEAQTRKKLAYTLGRMSARAREKIALIHLRPDVQEMLDEFEVEERAAS